MKARIKEFGADLSLGNNGVVFQFWDDDETYLGKLRVGRATIEWCSGHTKLGNGKKIRIKKLIELMQR